MSYSPSSLPSLFRTSRSSHRAARKWLSGIPSVPPAPSLMPMFIAPPLTASPALIDEKARLQISLRQAGIGTWEIDCHTRLCHLGEAYCEMYQIPYSSHARPFAEMMPLVASRIHPQDRAGVVDSVSCAINEGVPFNIEHRVVRPDGTTLYVHCKATPYRDEAGHATHLIGLTTDITPRRDAEAEISRLANQDTLTTLPNRALLTDRLQQAIETAQAYHHPCALLVLDLDGFKHINDTLGHEIGDLLLCAVAERLVSCLRPADTLARLGGDEFAALMPRIEEAEDSARLAQAMVAALQQPFRVGDGLSIPSHELFITASIGISVFPHDGRTPETLLRNADLAMYQAKEQGRNMYEMHSAEMNRTSLDRLLMESSLRRAVMQDELSLLYQPQFCPRTGRVEGVEALLRWNHPELGSVSRARFIPLAEETGLIRPMGSWVIRRACEQAARWRTLVGCDICCADSDGTQQHCPRICVNISARQLVQNEIADVVMQALDETGLSPSALELELTESFLLWNGGVTAAQTLRQLKEIGVRLSVDDFGTGYSSLSYLRRFPLDALKIDRSFTIELSTDRQTRAIVQAVINLSHALGLTVVAEGVETKEQLEILRDFHCDLVQGYLYSEAITPEAVSKLLQTTTQGGTPAHHPAPLVRPARHRNSNCRC